MRASLATFAAAALAVANAQNITVSFDAGKPKHVLADKRFLCYNIDTGSIYNGFDFTNKKLQHMVTQLGPTVVRIGGTAADYSWYLPDDPRRGDGDAHTIINDATWDSILQFIANTNTVLLWDFNALSFRDANNNWDPTWNATAFLARTQQVKPQGVEIWW